MSANLIIFDGYYTADQMRTLDAARNLVQEALVTLKQASLHEGWKCPESRNIDNALETIKARVGRIDQGIVRTAIALGSGLKAFTELEERSANQAHTLSDDLKNKYGVEASNYGQEEKTNLPVTLIPYDKNGVAIAKTGLSWLDEAEISGEAGLGKELISYLKSVNDFLNGEKYGLSGTADLCDLSGKSVGLYKELYEYLKDEDALSGGFGIVGEGFGLVSSICETADKINSGNLGAAGITGEIIGGVGGSVVDFGESIVKFKHISDTSTNITTKAGTTGLYSPLSIYTAIGKGYVDAFSQGFKSIEKYSADGKWDLGDTGRTGIEFGITGLYGIANALTFGGLEAIGKATGFTPENISRDIENWADDVGKGLRKWSNDVGNWANDVGRKAGDYIVNDPGLHEAYNNAGPIGKTAITLHATVQSGIQSVAEGIGNWFQSLWS